MKNIFNFIRHPVNGTILKKTIFCSSTDRVEVAKTWIKVIGN